MFHDVQRQSSVAPRSGARCTDLLGIVHPIQWKCSESAKIGRDAILDWDTCLERFFRDDQQAILKGLGLIIVCDLS